MLRTWMNAFPGVIKPRSDIPGYLLPHLRYPPDLFEVQRQILAKYHVQDPQSFYGGQNFWTVPNDPTGNSGNTLSQPPYYLTMTMPGYQQPEFSLTTTFVPRGRANLAAFMAVDSNPQSAYGTIRILQLPQDTAIAGPSQVQSAFETFARASIELTLLRKGGSKVTLGNLITLPVGGGLLYIEPVYVSAAAAGSSGSYPTLQRVFAFYGGHRRRWATARPWPTRCRRSSPACRPRARRFSGGQGTISVQVRTYLQQAEQAYTQAQAALRNGDFTAYGQAIATMKQALDNAQRAAQRSTGGTPSPAPSPARSAAAGASPSPSATR